MRSVILGLMVDFLAAIGVFILGLVLRPYVDELRRKSEEKRWYADYFLKRKYDAIYNLVSVLGLFIDALFLQIEVLKNKKASLEYFKKTAQLYLDTNKDFRIALSGASVFLSDEEKIKLSNLSVLAASFASDIWSTALKKDEEVEGRGQELYDLTYSISEHFSKKLLPKNVEKFESKL